MRVLIICPRFVQVYLGFGLYLVIDILYEIYRSLIIIFDNLLGDVAEYLVGNWSIGLAST